MQRPTVAKTSSHMPTTASGDRGMPADAFAMVRSTTSSIDAHDAITAGFPASMLNELLSELPYLARPEVWQAIGLTRPQNQSAQNIEKQEQARNVDRASKRGEIGSKQEAPPQRDVSSGRRPSRAAGETHES